MEEQLILLRNRIFTAKKYSMTPFTIIYKSKEYLISLNGNRDFLITRDGSILGTISVEAGAFALEWQSKDIQDKNLICELGELIAAQQLGNVPL